MFQADELQRRIDRLTREKEGREAGELTWLRERADLEAHLSAAKDALDLAQAIGGSQLWGHLRGVATTVNEMLFLIRPLLFRRRPRDSRRNFSGRRKR